MCTMQWCTNVLLDGQDSSIAMLFRAMVFPPFGFWGEFWAMYSSPRHILDTEQERESIENFRDFLLGMPIYRGWSRFAVTGR